MTLNVLPMMTSHQQLIHLTTSSIMSTTTVNNDLDTYYTNSNQADIDNNVRYFWDSFPCPPPWRPSLLTEVNISKLGPRIGESVKNFLAGKCQLQPLVPGIEPDDGWGDGDNFGGAGSKGTDHHATASSDHTWCNKTCQLAIGCSGVFVAMVIVALALVCLNRSRRKHKMPAARPSRQQLQMSTSTSDPINWAEFSNTQLQFDDDIIYPPFRHRDLPAPPTHCHHPSCDPKWTCQNGGAFRPLVRMSPSSTTYCTHGYTAVYEKIDDEDDDTDERPPCHHGRVCGAGERTANIQNRNMSMTGGVAFIPVPQSDPTRQAEEETVFNGDTFPVATLPRYFDLDGTYPNVSTTSSPDNQLMNNDSAWNQRNEFCFKAFQAHNNFLNNPPMYNQLCATCVPNVVSRVPPTCMNSHRSPNGFISNVSSFNVVQLKPSVNSISTKLPGYFPPNTSSFRQLSHHSDSLPCSNDAAFDESQPPPYNAHGCDLRHRHSNLQTDSNDPETSGNGDHTHSHPNGMLRGESNDSSNHEDQSCLSAHHSSPGGSPCRQWCPTCQQVPLLNGHDSSQNDLDSASSIRQTAFNMPWFHFKTPGHCPPHNQSNSTTADDNSRHGYVNDHRRFNINDANLAVGRDGDNASPATRNSSIASNSQTFINDLWLNSGSEWEQDDSSSGKSTDTLQARGGNSCVVSEDSATETSPKHNVMALHSHYFNSKSST